MPIINPVIAASIAATITTTNTAVAGGQLPLTSIAPTRLGVGSGAGDCDGTYSADFSIASGTPLSINLLALADLFDVSISVVRLVAIEIANNSPTSGQQLSIGGGSSPLFATLPSAVNVGPGGRFLWSSPLDGGGAITSGTNNNLQISATAGTIACTVRFHTRSA